MGDFWAFVFFIGLCCYGAYTITENQTKKTIAENCIDLGTVELNEYVISCDVKFLKSRDKLIPWKEVEK